MRSETIDKKNLATAPWEDDYFIYCNFEDFEMEGGHVTSDFIGCSFKNLDWYWGLFNCMNFIDCRFTDCVFRGTSFATCRFVECEFLNCRFLKDNLASECDFEDCVAYGCSVIGGEGFAVEAVGPRRRTGSFFPT